MKKTILQPPETRAIYPTVAKTRNPSVWVYRYHDATHDWTLSVATHAKPGSGMLSLGGFRIAPEERTSSSGFTTDREAIALAIGMEEKVFWSRVIRVGGPLTLAENGGIVGGKCVMKPTPDARVGRPGDAALLDFAVACFADVERTAGIRLVTGQDLGHGMMSDGHTQSLEYLHRRFKGSVVADTSKPTGEGNYQLLGGMLRALEIDLADATVGLVGCGNIGMYMLERLRAHGTTILALESRDARRREVEAMGIRAWPSERKSDYLAQPMDAIVLNAAGGSLDATTVAACIANAKLRVVCGSENLVMPDPSLAVALRDAGKVYAPTELGGMMGYLTAVEEYLSARAGKPFDVGTLLDAAKRLDAAGFDATAHVRTHHFAESFDNAVLAVYSEPVLA